MSNFNDTLFVFTTSPAGLGHIRVMDAIKEGRPTGVKSVDIGITDIKANRIHDLGSRFLPFVKLTEFYQTNPIAERLVTAFYVAFLRLHTKAIVDKFTEIAKEYPDQKKWVVISTHFALAHGISSAKAILENKLGIKIYLCVIVTDDSSQRVWAVAGADLTFVPSGTTKARLEKFLPLEKRDSIKAIAFPVAMRLSQNLTTEEFRFIVKQLDIRVNSLTQIEIPISGAAVQVDFLRKFMSELSKEGLGTTWGYSFTVIGQESLLTKAFFDKIQRLPRVQISIGGDPWETVNYYESLFYQKNRPGVEITKPSEQAFKALLNPRQRGGVILLLTNPIGRQEYDNLNFLIRNGLLATYAEQRALWEKNDLNEFVEKAKNWRAIRLPNNPIKAANFVKKLKQYGIFYTMLSAVIPQKPELRDDGVAQIWEEIGKLI